MTRKTNHKNARRIAICYDFDGTLAPRNMQEYDFIPALKMTSKAFWIRVANAAKRYEMDPILAYMHCMLEEAHHSKVAVRRQDLVRYGKGVQLFPGVQTWFSDLRAVERQLGVRFEHYLISSGLREMIEGTPIYKHFKKVYASGFVYDHNGVATWPAQAINYTTKTQFLFRINKGCLDPNDNGLINRFVPDDQRPVPFNRMIFIGDGETDIPCMRLVNSQGGKAIAVYRPNSSAHKKRAGILLDEGRATHIAPADYRSNQKLQKIVVEIVSQAT